MKKLNYLILPVFFFLFIAFMALNQIFGWYTSDKTDEKRALAPMPVINVNKLDTFPNEFDAYLNDNFAFRGIFLDAYHELKFSMKVAPSDADVVYGLNDQYFVIEKKAKNEVFSFTKHLPKLEQVWHIKKNYLDSLGIPSYWMIAPDKFYVYQEDLPALAKKQLHPYGEELQKYFNGIFPAFVNYPLKELLRAKKDDKLYLKQDTHWTEKGAFIAYQSIMKQLSTIDKTLKYLDESEVAWKTKTYRKGNILSFIGKAGILYEEAMVSEFPSTGAVEVEEYNFQPPTRFAYPWNYELHFKNPEAKNKKRVLVFRDSFGESLMPFFNETFSETLYIFDAWKYAINKEIVNTYQPDLIIFLSIESNITNFIYKDQLIEREE